MKKLISLLLAVLMLISVMPVSAFAEDDISYEIKDGVLYVSGEGIIPKKKFMWGNDFHTVIINEGITGIGVDAFAYSNVKTVSLPSTLESIEKCAFQSCHALEEINIPYGVESIADTAFVDCCALTEIEIPSSVTSIGIGAFYECYNLTAILHRTAQTNIDNNNAFPKVKKLIVEVPEDWSGDHDSLGANSAVYVLKASMATVYSWGELKNTLEGLSYNEYIRVKCSDNWEMNNSTDNIEIGADDCTIDFMDSYSIQSLCSNTGDYGVFFYINADNVTLNLNNKILRTGESTSGDYVSAIVVNGNNCHIQNGCFYDCGESGPANDKNEVWGAAIWVTKYDPGCTIENCTFESCHCAYGGAIYIGSSGATVKNCIFNGCYATVEGWDICDWSEDAVVEGCSTTNGDKDCFLYAREVKDCKFSQQFDTIWIGSTISEGNVWIVAAIGAAAVIAVAAVVIAKRKKKE